MERGLEDLQGTNEECREMQARREEGKLLSLEIPLAFFALFIPYIFFFNIIQIGDLAVLYSTFRSTSFSHILLKNYVS